MANSTCSVRHIVALGIETGLEVDSFDAFENSGSLNTPGTMRPTTLSGRVRDYSYRAAMRLSACWARSAEQAIPIASLIPLLD